MYDDQDAEAAKYRAMSHDELVNAMFDETVPALAAADLASYRAMSLRRLVAGLGEHDLVENGRCKTVIAERMEAVGIQTFSEYIKFARRNES